MVVNFSIAVYALPMRMYIIFRRLDITTKVYKQVD